MTTYDLVFWGEPTMVSLEEWVKLNEDKIMHGYIDQILKGDTMETQEIVVPEEGQGAAPGVSGGAIIALLPKLIEIATAILSGAGEVPLFAVRVFGQRVEVGPIPLKRG